MLRDAGRHDGTAGSTPRRRVGPARAGTRRSAPACEHARLEALVQRGARVARDRVEQPQLDTLRDDSYGVEQITRRPAEPGARAEDRIANRGRMPRSAWISPTSRPCTSPRNDADSPCTVRRSDEAVDTVASRLTTSRRPTMMTGRESVRVVCGTREAGVRPPAIHDTLGSTISIRSNARAPRRAAGRKVQVHALRNDGCRLRHGAGGKPDVMQRERQRSQCELDTARAEVDVVAIAQQDGDAIDQVSRRPRKGQDEQRHEDGQPAHRPHDPSSRARKKSHEVPLGSSSGKRQPPSRSACCLLRIGAHECSRSPQRRLEDVATPPRRLPSWKCAPVRAVVRAAARSTQLTYQRHPRGQWAVRSVGIDGCRPRI